MTVVVLAENKIFEVLIVVDNWEGVNLVVPNNIVGLFKSDGEFGNDKF